MCLNILKCCVHLSFLTWELKDLLYSNGVSKRMLDPRVISLMRVVFCTAVVKVYIKAGSFLF